VNQVYSLWGEGKIKPVVDSTWALEDVPEAMQKMHDRKNIGKIVLDPNLEPKPKPATPAKGKAKDKKAANQEEKKASSVESEEGDKKKEPELTNGTSEDKSDSGKKPECGKFLNNRSNVTLFRTGLSRTECLKTRLYFLFQIRKRRNLAELAIVTNPVRTKK
jgi:hypothetical protein